MEEGEMYLVQKLWIGHYDDPKIMICKRITKTSYQLTHDDKDFWVTKDDCNWGKWYKNVSYLIIEKI